MAEEAGTEGELPAGCRWSDLKAARGAHLLEFYRSLILRLSGAKSPRISAAYSRARTDIERSSSLEALLLGIDGADWFSAKREALGDIYEGLLEKNATEKKSGAGQYFTPRPLVDCIVSLVKPQRNESVQDPAAGSAGFLVAAHQWASLNGKPSARTRPVSYSGVELVPDVHRLGTMNLLLHNVGADFRLGDTLGEAGPQLPSADIALANPPFGTKKGNSSTRSDLPYPTSNKQFSFLQHIVANLTPDGRAAVVFPDNILFETGKGSDIRRLMMNQCDLHTILKLPTGLFYSPGVKTNVLFFAKRGRRVKMTERVWVYDLRTGSPGFGRTRPFERFHLADFEAAFGEDPYGKSPRTDQGEQGRFRSFSRAQIAERGDTLDMTWLSSPPGADDEKPETHLDLAMDALKHAMKLLEGLSDTLPTSQRKLTK